MAKRGPKTPEGKARALANLIPTAPGEVRNPHGRPSAGLSLIEWINTMAEKSRTEVEGIREDEEQPVVKRAAARVWLDAISGERNKAGSPIAGPELDRILDHTQGKARQSLDVTTDGKPLESRPVLVVPQTLSESEWEQTAKQLATGAEENPEPSEATAGVEGGSEDEPGEA